MRMKRRSGFTLVEVLISVVILTVGLLAVSQLYVTGMVTYQKARNMSLAAQRAQRELERVQNLTYTLIHTAYVDNKIVPNLYPTALGYAAYTDPNDSEVKGVTFTVDELPEGTGTVTFQPYFHPTLGKTVPNLLQVDVNIEWGGKPSTQTPVHLITLVVNK